jgi:hypothetical protein
LYKGDANSDAKWGERQRTMTDKSAGKDDSNSASAHNGERWRRLAVEFLNRVSEVRILSGPPHLSLEFMHQNALWRIWFPRLHMPLDNKTDNKRLVLLACPLP